MTPSSSGIEALVLAASGSCLYHCKGPTRPHAIATAGGARGWVYTCPAGTVSTVAFLGGARRPSPVRIRTYLQARTAPRERVQARDLRSATRHGPELGRGAERPTSADGVAAPIYLLYWRRYPKKVGRQYSYLYACFRHGPREVRFYPAPSARRAPPCPFCPASG